MAVLREEVGEGAVAVGVLERLDHVRYAELLADGLEAQPSLVGLVVKRGAGPEERELAAPEPVEPLGAS